MGKADSYLFYPEIIGFTPGWAVEYEPWLAAGIRKDLDVEISSVGRAERELLIQSKGLGEADNIAKVIVDTRKDGQYKSISDIAALEGVNLSQEELERVFTTRKLSKDEARGSTQLININEASFENIRERVQQLLVDRVVSDIRASLDTVFDNQTDVGDKTNLNNIETKILIFWLNMIIN